MTPEQEIKLLKELLYCTKRSCNNCGKVNCENFQRQRKDCCGLWVSYKDYIKQQEEQIADIKANCDLAIEGRDVKIMELEKQIEKMKEEHKKNELGLIISNSSARVELNEKIEVFEKENAKLESDFRICEKNADTYYDQLTKAKEIIRNIIRVTWGEGWNYSLDWKVKAEQFLKGENIILEDAQAGNSPFDADEVFNKEMKAYPEEKVK